MFEVHILLGVGRGDREELVGSVRDGAEVHNVPRLLRGLVVVRAPSPR